MHKNKTDIKFINKIMNPNKFELSSSEEEIYISSLKEAANQDFLKYFFKSLKSNYLKKEIQSKDFDTHQHYNHGLSQSYKDFIAKKLNNKLETNIILENKISKKNRNCSLEELSGINLLTTSNIILTEFDQKLKKYNKKGKFNTSYYRKLNFLKYQAITVNSKRIISQLDTKYWTHRKSSKQFKYKKLKNGILLEIK